MWERFSTAKSFDSNDLFTTELAESAEPSFFTQQTTNNIPQTTDNKQFTTYNRQPTTHNIHQALLLV